MANKTPYEVRLELLQMSKDYLDQMRNIQLEFARTAFEKSVELGNISAGQWKEYVPNQFSIDDIMKHATSLYSFVNKKD
jgi:hypothetical protein